MLKPENDTGKRARMICQNNLFEPNIILEMDQQMTSYNITCSGMGISFIGDIMLSKVPLTSDVVYYKLPAGESSRDIRFYWKKWSLPDKGNGRIFKNGVPVKARHFPVEQILSIYLQSWIRQIILLYINLLTSQCIDWIHVRRLHRRKESENNSDQCENTTPTRIDTPLIATGTAETAEII